MEPLASPDSYIAKHRLAGDDMPIIEGSLSDSMDARIEDNGGMDAASTPIGNQQTVVANITKADVRTNADEDDITMVTPKRHFKRESPSSLARHQEESNREASPIASMRDHIQRCQSVISSAYASEWVMNKDEASMRYDEEPPVDNATGMDTSQRQMEVMRTPPRSPKQRSNTMSLQPNNTPHRSKGLYVNVTDDFQKNPILASSVRSVRMYDAVDQEDIQRSLRVLGASRCWTDRFDQDLQGTIHPEQDEDYMATQTPIRSLTSYIPTSQSSYRYDSVQRSPICQPDTENCRDVSRTTSTCSAGRSSNITSTPNRYTQTMFGIGDATDLDTFDGARLDDMRREEVNPMAYATLPKSMVSEARMGTHFATLYKHFKNMCTFIRRSSMRNDRPYFKVVQLMVQRMTRKSFTLEHLRQLAWLAPNLVSFKWVNINEMVRKKYSMEYKDCHGDVIHDVQIRIHKLDGKICASTTDFENTCLSFKTIICAWVARAEAQYVQERGSSNGFDPDMALPVPMAALPTKQSGHHITADHPMSPPTTTPTHIVSKLPHRMSLDNTRSTAIVSSRRSVRDIQDIDTTDVFKSPPRLSIKRTVDKSDGASSGSGESSNKRSREVTMSPMSKELLDTPGMRRIREHAKRLSGAASSVTYDKKHDVSFWKDLRWFLNALVHLSIDEGRPPFMRLEWLAEFVTKYSSRRVTYDNVSEWANTLAQLAPDVMDVGVSKFDDYSTMLTLHPNAKFERIIQYVNDQINTYS